MTFVTGIVLVLWLFKGGGLRASLEAHLVVSGRIKVGDPRENLGGEVGVLLIGNT
jgi:hypothetical protein